MLSRGAPVGVFATLEMRFPVFSMSDRYNRLSASTTGSTLADDASIRSTTNRIAISGALPRRNLRVPALRGLVHINDSCCGQEADFFTGKKVDKSTDPLIKAEADLNPWHITTTKSIPQIVPDHPHTSRLGQL